MTKKKADKKQPHIAKVSVIVGLIIIALWGGSWGLITLAYGTGTERGTFGDMFGAINALFSGLAFAGLIVTLLYQKEELKLQREELGQTREELEGQRMEFKEQNETLRRQRFESTFFNMLTLQQEIVNGISFNCVQSPSGGSGRIPVTLKGREVFRHLYEEEIVYVGDGRISRGIRHLIQEHGIESYSAVPDISLFDHYFRHLYRIVKFVCESDLIEEPDRYDYMCIVRSQMSEYELVMLFYNCLTENGRDRFKPLIERYALLNNLRRGLLANEADAEHYASGAYVYTPGKTAKRKA